MKYRQLGTTNILLSEIGFGTWGIGGVTPGPTSYGPTDDAISLQALKQALDIGINFYDTSNVYGRGNSEELIGQAFKTDREKVIIATKVGLIDYESPSNFSSDYMRDSLENSLKRLKTDYIDLLQLHNPPLNIIYESDRTNPVSIYGTTKLTSENLIKLYGVKYNIQYLIVTLFAFFFLHFF